MVQALSYSTGQVNPMVAQFNDFFLLKFDFYGNCVKDTAGTWKRGSQPIHNVEAMQPMVLKIDVSHHTLRQNDWLKVTIWSDVSAWTQWPTFCRQHIQIHFLAWIWLYLINISPTFVPNAPIDNKSALVQVMARHQAGDISHYLIKGRRNFSTPYRVTRPQWVHTAIWHMFFSFN